MTRTARAAALTAAAALAVICSTASTAPAVEVTPTPTVPVTTGPPTASGPVGGAALGRAGVVTDLPAGVPAPPELAVASYVVADLDSGEVIAAKSAHAKRLPASTLKVLTALVLIPELPASARVPVVGSDIHVDGTKVGVVPGNSYTAKTLYQGLLMASGNDAAYALARAGGGTTNVLAQMNRTAEHLGAFDTVARDPSGLDAPGQTSSAYDLALIGRAAMDLADFRAYVTTKTVKFPGGKLPGGKTVKGFEVGNHNKLLWNYDGTVGIKNGYTEAAKQTFIGAATRSGRTYLVAFMGGDTGSWRPTAAMLDWAFANGPKARPVGTLVEAGSVGRPVATPTPTATSVPTASATATATAATTPPAAPETPATPGASEPQVTEPAHLAGSMVLRTSFATVTLEPQTRPWLIAGGAAVVVALTLGLLLPRRRRD